jgi:hypothetical protein
MKISRRKFLSAAPIAAGAVLCLGGAGIGQTSDSGSRTGADSLSQLSWGSFYAYVGTTFTFRDSVGNAVDLRLAEMTDNMAAGKGSRNLRGECFSLVFSGPAGSPLKQDVYSIEHFALGSFGLLITEGQTIKRRKSYEAVINRTTMA